MSELTKKLPREQVILSYIHDHAAIRGCTVVEDLEKDPYNIPRTTTFAYLTSLVKQSKLLRDGTRRNYTYSVPKTDA